MNNTQKKQIDNYIYDGMNAFEREVKRWFDFIMAGMCIIIFSPLFLACYLAVRRGKDGPIIYRQERIGRFGRPFYIYKFRTMVTNAENSGPQLCNNATDIRLTQAGRWMRRYHLDELPQFWNVLKGEMSFVGPRPERPYYIDQIMERDSRYLFLYQIRPGITSYATIYNGYTDTMEKMLLRLEMDLNYLRHRSWWQDLKILSITFYKIVTKTINNRASIFTEM